MASRISNYTGRWRARAVRTAGLGSLVLQLALCCGTMNAAGQPAIANYADLPELSGPFSELTDVPESLTKKVSLLRTSRGELVILPGSLRFYPNERGFRLEHDLLAAAAITPGPPARLELFVQTVVDDLASLMVEISRAYPLAKVGRPKIAEAIAAELHVGSIFGERHKESIVTLGSEFSISDIVFVTFEPSHYFMRALVSDGDIVSIGVSYKLPFQNTVRQFQMGMSLSFNCRTSPGSFLDLMHSVHGCPDYESWKLAAPNSDLGERLADCVAKADVPLSMPEIVRNRWKEWNKKDCAITLLSGRRPG